MNRIARWSVLIALVVSATACAGGAPSQSAAAPRSEVPTERTAAIEIRSVAFKPATLTVLRGTTVTWVNHDADVRHTATSGTPGNGGVPGVSEASPSKPDGLFDGDLPEAGARFAFTFDQAGTYAYFCEVHPSMTATVVVE
jgi:plastocyanin